MKTSNLPFTKLDPDIVHPQLLIIVNSSPGVGNYDS